MSEFLKNSLNATLMGGERITRSELDNIPAPKKIGPRHRPIPHAVLLNTLEAVCEDVNLVVDKAHLAVTAHGDNIFGILEIRPRPGHILAASERPGQGFCLGFRSGNRGRIALRIVAGLTVFNCENLIMSGDELLLSRKHTTGLQLLKELETGVARYTVQQSSLVRRTDWAKETVLEPEQAKILIFDQFHKRVLAPRYFSAVVKNYFQPDDAWTDCIGQTRWSLHNAFTRAIRPMGPAQKFTATQKLAQLVEPPAPPLEQEVEL